MRNVPEIRNRTILIAIGVGTLVLALIAFSGICWGALGAVGGWFGQWTFWEFFALSALVLAVMLMIRPIGRRLAGRSMAMAPTADTPVPAPPAHRTTSERDTTFMPSAPNAAASAPVSEEIDCSERRSTWRELYNQLSSEERAEFKALMEKYCGCSPEAPTEDAESPKADRDASAGAAEPT